MKLRTKYTYRLACNYEVAPPTSTLMPDQLAAVRAGWKAAGNPYVTRVRVMRAPEGSEAFVTAHHIKG